MRVKEFHFLVAFYYKIFVMFLFHKVPQILLMPLSGGTLSFSEERYMLLILEENVLNPEMEESWNGIISTMLRTEINLEN